MLSFIFSKAAAFQKIEFSLKFRRSLSLTLSLLSSFPPVGWRLRSEAFLGLVWEADSTVRCGV